MSLTVDFTQAEAGAVSVVGGKGANLLALTRAGFAVPPGFVVTAAAYDLFLGRADWLDAEMANFAYDRPDRLREQCAVLRERLAAAALPGAVADAVRAALARLGAPAVAVRSSSTFEDLAQAAFAGQHDTYLNVRGADEVCAKVRDCFVSLWADRAVLYRRRQGFAQREARMAAVVQRQAACDRAGVGFSADPVSGRAGRLAIDANYGLGESVVAGECEVDHFELDKATLDVVGRTVGRKARMVVPAGDGVEERAVPDEQAVLPCLTDAEVRSVGELLRRVEGHYGWPQDVEWGFEGGALYLFQARPVTVLPPRWTRDESAERFPGPVTPLSWDFLEVAFRASAAHSLALMGLPPLQADWFACFGHHVYGNQNAVELLAALRPLRARDLAALEAELPALRRRFAWVLDLPVAWARDLDRYLLRLGRLSGGDLEAADVPALWRHAAEVLEATVEQFRPNVAISMTHAALHRLLHALVGMAVGPERALPVIDGLLAGCETKTACVNRELHGLALLARRTPALREALRAEGGRAFWEGGRLDAFPEFAAAFGRFLEDHGHREMDMDFYHPVWSEQPWVVLDAVALVLRGGPGADPAEAARQLRQRFAEAEHAFLAGLPGGLRFFFRELVRLTRAYVALDDLEHYQTTRAHPVARRALLALGRRLQGHGVLDAPADVFFLRKAELEALAAGYPQLDRDGWRERAYAAKRSYEASREAAPPWTPEEDDAPAAAGEVLRGLAGSPGRVTGPVFRVREAADFARFPRGAVLVARTTNPSWTPLFYGAAGLVTESGGPLSHGAVTAREMRLPAVMSVRGVMDLLRDGQVVTVDGARGTVTPEP